MPSTVLGASDTAAIKTVKMFALFGVYILGVWVLEGGGETLNICQLVSAVEKCKAK